MVKIDVPSGSNGRVLIVEPLQRIAPYKGESCFHLDFSVITPRGLSFEEISKLVAAIEAIL
jgi:hypothetical protein